MSYEAALAAAMGAGDVNTPKQKSGYEDIMLGLAPASGGAAQPASNRSELLDTGNAVGTGFFRGLTRLLGLPADTAANVLDLGKAAAGTGYIAATGKAPPRWLEVGNRADVVGSGDNMIRALSKTAPGNMMVNPANPEYEGGYAQAAGSGLNAVIAPASKLQAANQAVLGVTSAFGAKLGMETGNPAWAVIGGLAPSGVQQAGTAVVKAAVLGANPLNAKALTVKRRGMEQRTQDLQHAGIENPTLGLASGNKVIGGIENILQSTPGAVGVMSRARDAAIAGLQSKADEAARLASTNRGALESGVAIQRGIGSFKEDFKGKQEGLYNRLSNHIPGQTQTDVTNTRQTLGALNADIVGAPELSKFFKNEKILALQRALDSDTAGTVPPSPISIGVNGQAFANSATLPTNSLPFEAVKKTRTLVGNEIADFSLLSSVPQAKWRALYGGLSEDMSGAAQIAGPQAQGAFSRATDYTRAGSQRLERVAPFAQMVAPEQAYTAMVNAARENVSTLQAVKKTLPPDARGTVAGTVIERLGKATNGVQNADGTAWSPETFLTNWNKMTPRAREELFSGFKNSADVKSSVESVAQATAMMRESSKMWANPSGTGANLAARGLLATVGVGGPVGVATGLLNPWVPAGIATGILGANLSARALTSKGVREAMARPNYVSPGIMRSQAIPLLSGGLLSEGLE